MSSTNSTIPPSSNNQSNDTNTNDRPNSMGAATYYGAAVIVIFLLIALAIAFRILYTRKFRRRNASDEEVIPDLHDQEERLAMERRGEEAGLPTYRESILRPNGDTILAATPISSHPFPRSSTPETLPNRDSTLPVLSTIADENVQPPKYEEDRSVDLASLQVQHLENSDRPNVEMRMSSNSNTTLVLPSINVQPAQDQQLNRSRPSISEPPSFDPSPSRPPTSNSNAAS